MIRQLRFAAVAVLLASCSTIISGQIQDVTIEAQGASNVLCYMQNSEFSFRFYPPQTLKVTKSSEPYTIRCLAPGNLEKTLIVEPKLNAESLLNVANLGTGLAVDHTSAAMYDLPDKIIISFEGMTPTGYSQPAYNEFFDQNPQLKGVEEFRPGQPALMRDAGKETNALEFREMGTPGSSSPVVIGGRDPLGDAKDGITPSSTVSVESSSAPVIHVTLPPPPVPAASQSMSADSLTRSMNPQIFGGSSAPAASGAPVSINPQ